MVFNNKKIELMKYGTKEHLKQFQYKVDNEEIEVKHTLGDLGVWMSDDGKFGTHISHTTKTPQWLSGWILRTFQTRQPQHLLPVEDPSCIKAGICLPALVPT